MAEALSGKSDAHEVLARIAARDGLITRSAGMPPVYAFMPLFREFLLARLADTFAPAELQALAKRAGALLEKNPEQNWLGDGELLEAYRALRRGDRVKCHQLLCAAITDAHYVPEAAQACAVFPRAVAQLCAEALRESIAPECTRWLIERHRLPAPVDAGQHWPWPYKVYVLGRFRLLKADAPLRFSRRAPRKPLELLQALIAFGATEVPARALIDALWPDSEGDAGYHALESALYRLRQLLGAADAVRMENSGLSLDRSQFWVDMWEVEDELQGTRRTEPNRPERVRSHPRALCGTFSRARNRKALGRSRPARPCVTGSCATCAMRPAFMRAATCGGKPPLCINRASNSTLSARICIAVSWSATASSAITARRCTPTDVVASC